MNKSLVLSSCLILISAMCASIHAQTMTPSSVKPASGMMMNGGKHHHDQSCMNIAVACESAGYRLRDMSGKSIWKDCVKSIISGNTISGVTANPADIQSCKTHMEVWKNKHMNKMQEVTPAAATPAS